MLPMKLLTATRVVSVILTASLARSSLKPFTVAMEFALKYRRVPAVDDSCSA
jgi:hypothetical protein